MIGLLPSKYVATEANRWSLWHGRLGWIASALLFAIATSHSLICNIAMPHPWAHEAVQILHRFAMLYHMEVCNQHMQCCNAARAQPHFHKTALKEEGKSQVWGSKSNFHAAIKTCLNLKLRFCVCTEWMAPGPSCTPFGDCLGLLVMQSPICVAALGQKDFWSFFLHDLNVFATRMEVFVWLIVFHWDQTSLPDWYC